jgi:hypothetical protein
MAPSWGGRRGEVILALNAVGPVGRFGGELRGHPVGNPADRPPVNGDNRASAMRRPLQTKGFLMIKAIATWGALLLLSVCLAGCDVKQALMFTAEDRVNAAFPVPESVRNTRASLIELAADGQRKDIDIKLNTRLRLRALGCAKSYSPAWLTSPDDIRSNIGEPACFTQADEEIARWLSLRRIGLIMAQPALKPVPAKAPAFIMADDFIESAQFAANAGVALLTTPKAIELVDLETSKQIFREAKSSATSGSLSPNGRLFTTGEGDNLKIRDAQSGAVLAELKSVRYFEFHWVDERTAFYNKSDSSKAVLIDLVSGSEIPLSVTNGGVQRVVPVPKSSNQYVLLAWQAVAKIEVMRDKPNPEVKLLAEKQISSMSWALNTSGLTADGSRYFGINRSLSVVSLDSLEVETIPFEPFNLQGAQPTPDADKLLIVGFVQPPRGDGSRDLLYSITNRTVMPIDRAQQPSQRILYIPSLHKQAVINVSKIAVLDDLPTTEATALPKFISDALELANQRKMEAFEQQQAQQLQEQQQSRNIDDLFGSPIRPNAVGEAPAFVANRVVASLARDAQIEAVGVYQGNEGGAVRTGEGRRTGYVEVRIRRSSKPVVLVLSSYEAVRWTLITEPGARLNAVLLSGYKQSQVVGAGSARVFMIGSNFAYKLGSSEYNTLDQETMRWTGKGIGVFQGRYEGSAFSVGG